ncbi:MAG: hypothetical protein ACR2KK_16585 [Acidimicrobiales bacterium]
MSDDPEAEREARAARTTPRRPHCGMGSVITEVVVDTVDRNEFCLLRTTVG